MAHRGLAKRFAMLDYELQSPERRPMQQRPLGLVAHRYLQRQPAAGTVQELSIRPITRCSDCSDGNNNYWIVMLMHHLRRMLLLISLLAPLAVLRSPLAGTGQLVSQSNRWMPRST